MSPYSPTYSRSIEILGRLVDRLPYGRLVSEEEPIKERIEGIGST